MSRPTRRSASRKKDEASPKTRRSARTRRAEAAPQQDEELEELPELDPIDDEELPELEPVEEDLPELEPALDERCDVSFAVASDADDADFNLVVHLKDASLPKKEVPELIDPHLRSVINEHGSKLRWRRVSVQFKGETLVPSAVKEQVAGLMGQSKPAFVVVQRGYGDEIVVESNPPKLDISVSHSFDEPPGVGLQVKTEGLSAADMTALLPSEITRLNTDLREKAVKFTFDGDALFLTRSLRKVLREVCDSYKSRSLTVATDEGEELMFDRELETRVQLEIEGTQANLTVRPSDNEQMTRQALDVVLDDGSGLKGKVVLLKPESGKLSDAEQDLVLTHVKRLGAVSLTLEQEGSRSVLFPDLLRVQQTKSEIGFLVVPGERTPVDLRNGFDREVQRHADGIRAKVAVVNFPESFEIDSGLRESVVNALIGHGAARVAFLIGGKDRVPVHPEILPMSKAADEIVLELDTDAGKPAEILRAMEPRLEALKSQLRDNAVAIHTIGEGMVSRSLKAALTAGMQAASVSRAVLVEHGDQEFLWPKLLIVDDSEADVRVGIDMTGRSVEEAADAAKSELAEIDLGGRNVRVQPSELDDVLVATFVEKGAAKVILDGPEPVQVHPAFLTVERGEALLTIHVGDSEDSTEARTAIGHELPRILAGTDDYAGTAVTIVWGHAVPVYDRAAQPQVLAELVSKMLAHGPKSVTVRGGDSEALSVYPRSGGHHVSITGQRQGATPPLTMISVRVGDEPGHAAATGYELSARVVDFTGHRLLVTLIDGEGTQVQREDHDEVVAIVRHVLAPTTGALLFQGLGADGVSHFEVCDSNLDALPIGFRTKDPRPAPKQETDEAEASAEKPEEKSEEHDLLEDAAHVAGSAVAAHEGLPDQSLSEEELPTLEADDDSSKGLGGTDAPGDTGDSGGDAGDMGDSSSSMD